MSVRTAESVCVGHPDKLCDLIADQIVDDVLFEDKTARVAVEVMVTGRYVVVAGEISTTTRPRIRESVRTALLKAGYRPWRFVTFVWIRRQSADIDAGVSMSLEARDGDDTGFVLQGAGDQGTVYGYATNETPERLPLPLVLAHNMCRRLDQARTEGAMAGIKPDGKAQVSVRYDRDGEPVAVETVVVSIQHDAKKDPVELEREVKSLIVEPACRDHLPITDSTVVLVNPSGRFVKGGAAADTGVTGRKLMVDTYGGLAPHGGGAFSGKDPSKVDRSAAYLARMIAKTIVDTRLATEATVAISYAIGKADPVAFTVDTHGTGEYPDDVIAEAARVVFPLRPGAIIDLLGLRSPRYARLTAYGHVGVAASWENSFRFARELYREVSRRADHTVTDQ